MKRDEQLFIIKLIKDITSQLNDGISISFDETQKGSDIIKVSLKPTHKLIKQYFKDYKVSNIIDLPKHVRDSLKIKEQLIKYNLICRGLQEYYNSGV